MKFFWEPWDGKLKEEDEIRFLRCCTLLGNARLALFILRSMHSEVGDEKSSSKKSDSASPCDVLGRFPDLETLISSCAHQFSVYSAAELQCLSTETIHELLKSDSLWLETEDALLARVIEIDSEEFHFWHHIHIEYLSTEGLARYAQKLPFGRVDSDVWATVALHLQGICDEELRAKRFLKGPGTKPQATVAPQETIFSLSSILGRYGYAHLEYEGRYLWRLRVRFLAIFRRLPERQESTK
jgi:hypothetical protein